MNSLDVFVIKGFTVLYSVDEIASYKSSSTNKMNEETPSAKPMLSLNIACQNNCSELSLMWIGENYQPSNIFPNLEFKSNKIILPPW